MTEHDFNSLGRYVSSLWPAFQPTPEQRAAWYKALARYSASEVKAALDLAFAATRWREPALPDVLDAIKSSRRGTPPAFHQQTPEEEAAAQAVIAADLALKNVGQAVHSVKRPPGELWTEAQSLRARAAEVRRFAGNLQAEIDEMRARLSILQTTADGARKNASEILAEVEAISLELKVADYATMPADGDQAPATANPAPRHD